MVITGMLATSLFRSGFGTRRRIVSLSMAIAWNSPVFTMRRSQEKIAEYEVIEFQALKFHPALLPWFRRKNSSPGLAWFLLSFNICQSKCKGLRFRVPGRESQGMIADRRLQISRNPIRTVY